MNSFACFESSNRACPVLPSCATGFQWFTLNSHTSTRTASRFGGRCVYWWLDQIWWAKPYRVEQRSVSHQFRRSPWLCTVAPTRAPELWTGSASSPRRHYFVAFFTSENCDMDFSGSMSPSQLSTHLNFVVPSNMDMYDRLLATRHVS
jgi:hypothetical protein